jgi:hypothetical protein
LFFVCLPFDIYRQNYLAKRTIKIATQQIELIKLPCALIHVFPGIALQTTDWELETHDESAHARSSILAPSIWNITRLVLI